MKRNTLTLAALVGATAVALGAFGAHGLKAHLGPTLLETWETAVRYHMVHAVALLALAAFGNRLSKCTTRRAELAWGLGILLFSGSLYVWCLTGFRPLVFVTPIGGVLLILGWLSLLRS